MIEVLAVLFTAVAMYLISLRDDNPWRRWGYIAGLISEFFWFPMTWYAEQYWIFGLCVFVTYSWANGINNHFNRRLWKKNGSWRPTRKEPGWRPMRKQQRD